MGLVAAPWQYDSWLVSTDDDVLRRFLLEQFARDEQTARAMSHAIERMQSRWSPARLIADCQAKRRIVENFRGCPNCEMGQPCTRHGIDIGGAAVWRFLRAEDRVTALQLTSKYAGLRGYQDDWSPAVRD